MLNGYMRAQVHQTARHCKAGTCYREIAIFFIQVHNQGFSRGWMKNAIDVRMLIGEV
jgi:hypothetical protein